MAVLHVLQLDRTCGSFDGGAGSCYFLHRLPLILAPGLIECDPLYYMTAREDRLVLTDLSRTGD